MPIKQLKKSVLNAVAVLAVCGCALPVASLANPTVAAKLHALENNKTYQASRVLESRGYKVETVKMTTYNGDSVLDVDAKRDGQRVNFKILESTLQIISETRY